MEVYQLAKWSETFEKSESRRYKVLTWVSIPNDLGCNGIQTLVENVGDEAAELYGVWCALVAIASKAPRRGVLASSNGKPYTFRRLASLSQGLASEDQFKRLFEVVAAPEIGWLIPFVEQPTTATQQNAELRDETNPTEQIGSVDGDHKDGEPESFTVARSRAQTVFCKMGGKPKELDVLMVSQAAFLSMRAPYTENWLYDGVEAVRAASPKPNNPWAYLRQSWTNYAKDKFRRNLGKDFHAVVVPPDFLGAPKQPSPRLCGEPEHAGVPP